MDPVKRLKKMWGKHFERNIELARQAIAVMETTGWSGRNRRRDERRKNPHAAALGRLGGLRSGGRRPGAGRPVRVMPCGRPARQCRAARHAHYKPDPHWGRQTKGGTK